MIDSHKRLKRLHKSKRYKIKWKFLQETRYFKYEIKRETISKNNLINDMTTLSVKYK